MLTQFSIYAHIYTVTHIQKNTYVHVYIYSYIYLDTHIKKLTKYPCIHTFIRNPIAHPVEKTMSQRESTNK